MFPVYFALSFLTLSVRALKESEAEYNSKVLTENRHQSSINGIYNLSSIEVLSRTIPSNNLEAYMSTVEIVISRGYHVEMHQVTTADGYILMLHRIPYPKGRNSGPTGRPVFILHGFALSSAVFVILPSKKALAFVLADLGYDVWLGNSRGNTYSRGHVTLDSSHDDLYWKFSADEMGRYDNPAFINYILSVTAREKLLYVAHSQGITALFTCLHYHPKFNGKIELMVAMAPISTFAHTKTLFSLLVPLQYPLRFVVWLFGQTTYFTSQDGLYSKFVKRFCLKNARLAILCHNLLYSIAGPDYGNMSPGVIKVVNNHIPAGVSLQNLIHNAQNSVPTWKNPKFNLYNYGWIGNLKHYGQINPPAYNLSTVTLPTYLFYAKNDYLATPKDVQWTASKLPNVKQLFMVEDPSFNHMDFIFHHNVKDLVYDRIITILPPP